jgi:hypothetical protein
MERYGIVHLNSYVMPILKIQMSKCVLLVSNTCMNNRIQSYVYILNYWEFHFYLSVCVKPINASCIRYIRLFMSEGIYKYICPLLIIINKITKSGTEYTALHIHVLKR